MNRLVKKIFSIVVVFLVASVSLLTGCSKKTQSADGSDEALVIGATAIPQSMDMVANDGAAIPQALLYNVYETLVKLDDQGNLVPGLASSWEISEDRLTYTFKLYSEARFASGAIVDADAVVTSIENARSGSKTSPTIRAQMSVISKVTAVDNQTVEILLNRPSNNWLYDMTQSGGIIIEPGNLNNMDTKTFGSGPYLLQEWKQNESVTLERNDNYWGENKPYYKTVTFKYYVDSNAMNSAMLAGDLDIVSNVAAPQALSAFDDASKYSVYEGTSTLEVILAFNHENQALSDVKVRKAINYAIDKQGFVDTVWGGKGLILGSMVPPSDPWYEDRSGDYPYDPDQARQLLNEAGYGDGLTLRLRVPTLPYATDGAQYVASQLKEVGISVVVDELEFPARWIDVVMAQTDYDMTIIAHAEPRDFVQFGNADYYWNYDNPEVAELIIEADRSTEAEMIAHMQKAAKLVSDDAAADFLFLMPNLVVTKPGLTGVPINATTLSYDVTEIRPES